MLELDGILRMLGQVGIPKTCDHETILLAYIKLSVMSQSTRYAKLILRIGISCTAGTEDFTLRRRI